MVRKLNICVFVSRIAQFSMGVAVICRLKPAHHARASAPAQAVSCIAEPPTARTVFPQGFLIFYGAQK
jgi:hypothetical protein